MTASLIVRASRTHLQDFDPVPIEAIEDGDLQVIPLVGTVSAGEPIDIYEEAEELEVPAAWVTKNSFALRVRGDSMIDDHIQDGDLIVVEQRTYADNGETVVVRINGDRTTLKKLYIERDHLRLQPANSTMEPLILRHADVEVLGIVKVIVRKP